MTSNHSALIEHHERSLDQILARLRKGERLASKKPLIKKPTIRPFLPKPEKMTQIKSERLPRIEHMRIRAIGSNPNIRWNWKSPLAQILAEDFLDKFLSGEEGTFETLVQFLGDETKNPSAIGIKNYYLRLLRNYPFSDDQIKAVQQLIWDYAHGKQGHRYRIFARLAIRVSTPRFHRAFTEAAQRCDSKSGWKIHLICKRLDHHCPETKPAL
jgi:hypothetical protein